MPGIAATPQRSSLHVSLIQSGDKGITRLWGHHLGTFRFGGDRDGVSLFCTEHGNHGGIVRSGAPWFTRKGFETFCCEQAEMCIALLQHFISYPCKYQRALPWIVGLR